MSVETKNQRTRPEILGDLLGALLEQVSAHPENSDAIIRNYARALDILITRCAMANAALHLPDASETDVVRH